MKNIFEKIVKLSDERIEYFMDDIKKTDSKFKYFFEWYKTYNKAIFEEMEEVQDEVKKENSVYLEDELWDVFWCYCCFLQSLEKEWYITSVEKVFERSYNKFNWRINHMKKNPYQLAWKEIKDIQKKERKKEHEEKYWK